MLVEDDQVDVANVLRAFKAQGIENLVQVAADGREALELLQQQQAMAKPLPKIILLDLNLPHMNGLEFLQEIRKDDHLKACSVFVMSSSTTEQDLLAAYELNVAGYIQKPVLYESFLEMVTTLNSYWNLIELPN
nr:response regulator [Rufibacter sp. LB8]